MMIADRVSVSSMELTAEGYLRAPSKIARVGVQEYYAFEFGISPGDKVLRLYRPVEEVFSPDALASFALKPVTLGHPPGGVLATTWRDHAVGTSGEKIGRDGDHVTATLLITHPDAINDVQRGVVELSCGYDFDLDLTPGATPDGEPYDGVMRGIRGNHIAIVPQGRCGGTCKIGDRKVPTATDCGGVPACKCASQPQKDTPTMKTVTIDGATFDVADDKLAAAIDGLLGKLATRDSIMADLKTLLPGMDAKVSELTATIAAKDAEIAAAKAEAEEAAKKVPSAADLNKLAAERAAVIDKAKAVAPDLEPGDKSTAEIMRATVEKVRGADAVKDRSDDYVAGIFEALSAGDADPIAKTHGDGSKLTGRDAYNARLANAWKGKTA